MNTQKSLSGSRLFEASRSLNADNVNSTLLSAIPKGGGDINGLMTLFMSNQSIRELSKKIVQYNAAAVLGAIAYKAHAAWQSEMPLAETTPITNHDITQSSSLPKFAGCQSGYDEDFLAAVLMKTMIAALKSGLRVDLDEQRNILNAAEQLGFDSLEVQVIDVLMSRDITVAEIAGSVSLDKHKAQVYLAAYFSIRDNSLSGRKFLEDLAKEMDLPSGLSTYLEWQASIGINNV